jgi:hypothetical protein
MPDAVNRRDLPMQTRLASFVPDSFSADTRTIEVVWTTGARVPRMDWWTGKRFDEELSLDPSAVRLARLNSGAPVLDTHGQYALGNVLGVVERAWLDRSEGRATLRFSDRAEVAPIVRDIEAGIVRNVSVGYIVHKYRVETTEERETRVAVDWEPTEISFVPIGADAGAGTRSQGPLHPCIIEGALAQKETRMPDPVPTAGGESVAATPIAVIPPASTETRSAAAAPPTGPDVAAEVQRALAADRQRAADIRTRCRAVGLDDSFADGLVTRGVAADLAGNAIVDELARRSAGANGGPAIGIVQIGQSGEDPAVIRQRLIDAFAARGTENLPSAPQGARIGTGRLDMPDAARQYAGLGLLHGLAEYARALGHRVPNNLERADLFDRLTQIRALSTSDFPILLAATANKMLMALYQLATPSYRLVAARRNFADFKAHTFIKTGDFPQLLAKGENGEYRYGSISESSASVSLLEYGRIVPLGRRVLINDDLNALSDLVGSIGRRIPDLENSLVWAILTSASGAGPNLTDFAPGAAVASTAALFSANFDTLDGVAAAISIAAIGKGRTAMMKKTSLDGLKINILPKYLITSPDQYTLAEQYCATNVAATQASNFNPFAGRLEPVGEANIVDATDWYLFADPAVAPTVVYGYLGSQQGPRIESRSSFTSDGLEVKAALDFGHGAVDYRGGWRNPGA